MIFRSVLREWKDSIFYRLILSVNNVRSKISLLHLFDQTVENVNTLAALLQALPDSQQEKLRRALLALADQMRKVGA